MRAPRRPNRSRGSAGRPRTATRFRSFQRSRAVGARRSSPRQDRHVRGARGDPPAGGRGISARVVRRRPRAGPAAPDRQVPEHPGRAARQGPPASPARRAHGVLHRPARPAAHRASRRRGVHDRGDLSLARGRRRLLLAHGPAAGAHRRRADIPRGDVSRDVGGRWASGSRGGIPLERARAGLRAGRAGRRRVALARAHSLCRRPILGATPDRRAVREEGLNAGLEEPLRSRVPPDSRRRQQPGARLPRGRRRPVLRRARQGARIWDVDGRSYLDFLGSWGPLILGHAAPPVVAAIVEAAARGTSYGAPTGLEVDMAEAITAAYPSIELVRLVSSGTEAAMSAIRLARGATGRSLLVKFDGCYHGHADSLLVKAGSGGATFSIPDSAGVPAPLAGLALPAPFNDLEAVAALFRARGDEIAGVIVEPVAGNMGVVAPLPGFLEGLREITHAHGALLIFDEVITGFRVAYGGAQALYGVRPDLTCLGKIIGGGLPVGAYGGARQLMGQVAPLGPVYQAGTLSGNPLAVAAGLATLRELGGPDVYATLDARGALLERGLREGARKARIPLTVNRVGSMLTAFFCDGPVTDYASAKRADTARYARYFHAMRERGVFLAPSQFEAAFVSLAHTEADLELAARAAADALASLSR